MKRWVLTGFLILILFVSGCGNAAVDVELAGWGRHEFGERNLIWMYAVQNSGSAAAEDVSLVCKLYNSNGDVMAEGMEQLESLEPGSTSGEMTAKMSMNTMRRIKDNPEEKYSAGCYVVSCVNCEIADNEAEEIPLLQKSKIPNLDEKIALGTDILNR